MMHSMLFFFILLFVQVVVESLPVSSSAHVQLVQKYVHVMEGMSGCALACIEIGKKMVAFDVLLHLMHLPTLVIILFYFRDRLFFLIKLLCRSCQSRFSSDSKWLALRSSLLRQGYKGQVSEVGPVLRPVRRSFNVVGSFNKVGPALRSLGEVGMIIAKILCLTALADCVTILFYIFFKSFPPVFPLGIGFCITASLLYSLRWVVPSHAIWNWRYALILGTVQGIALLPGVSRFAAVYVCACWLGLPQRKAFEITWLVQVPLIFAACAQSMYVLWKADQLIPLLNFCTLSMTILATVWGLCAFYLAAYLAREGKLWWFSFYMIVPMVAWLYLCFML